jgi:ribosomal protein S18 acetylase RimI-like enzyme
MGDLDFRGMSGASAGEVARLCSLNPDADRLGRFVSATLAGGGTRPEWCRSASSVGAGLLAAHSFWGRPPSDTPTLVDLLGHRDHAAATALLSHDLDWLAVDAMDCQLVTGDDADEPLRRLRAAEGRVLADAGFELMVDRVRVEWLPSGDGGLRPARRSLTIRPADEFTADQLLALFAGVGDGSPDAHMIADRARLGRIGEARERLARCTAMRHTDDGFAIGVDPDGIAVGYVLATLVDGDRPVLAEIGVTESARGHRYVDQLLAHGTRLLAGNGATRIRGDVDVSNRPMRAAFSRAGYREFATRQDYRWLRPAR